MKHTHAVILGLGLAALSQPALAGTISRSQYDAMVAAHARANGVPEALVHRVIVRESRYNPRLIGKGGAMGLMQIKTATARGVGYSGSASGLLDAETNMTYAVRYLAGAYRLAGGNHDRAVSYYARGYYYAAKTKGATIQTLAVPGGAGAQSFALFPGLGTSTTAEAAATDVSREKMP
jgi:soluble lytic murein transglycosylase-like protein